MFVLTPDGKSVAGYYSLSQYALDLGQIPEELLKRVGSPKYPHLPVTLIGRLARNLEFRGRGVGELLLISALEKAFVHSKAIASFAVVVDAKYDRAKEFYVQYGFIVLPEHPTRLFLPMKTVEGMFEGK